MPTTSPSGGWACFFWLQAATQNKSPLLLLENAKTKTGPPCVGVGEKFRPLLDGKAVYAHYEIPRPYAGGRAEFLVHIGADEGLPRGAGGARGRGTTRRGQPLAQGRLHPPAGSGQKTAASLFCQLTYALGLGFGRHWVRGGLLLSLWRQAHRRAFCAGFCCHWASMAWALAAEECKKAITPNGSGASLFQPRFKKPLPSFCFFYTSPQGA